MQTREVIVVGASAGGVEALVELARGLPAGLPAAMFVVLHLPADARSMLPHILSRAGPLPAVQAEDGATIRPGTIYVAPPNRHLLLEGSTMRLAIDPRVNGVRPSIDVLFRSAARAFQSRVIGVELSGTHSDGALGLEVIKLRGGIVIVQDPGDARFAGMPLSALARVQADYVVPVAEIAPLLARLTRDVPRVSHQQPARRLRGQREEGTDLVDPNAPWPPPHAQPSPLDPLSADEKVAGAASGLTCPDCHGSLWELDEESVPRIECRVGHAFSIDAFLGKQAVALEEAIWSAINSLEERAMTLRRFADRVGQTPRMKDDYQQRADLMASQALLLREGLVRVIQAEEDGLAQSTAGGLVPTTADT